MAEVRSYEQPAVLASGSRVIVLVSKGPFEVPPAAYVGVPDVIGETQGAALSAFQDAGFQARVYNDYSDSFARGRVMGQLPAAGTNAASGSEVVLLVSSGSAASTAPAVKLPDVVGLHEPEAVSRLQGAGLSPQVARDFSPTVPVGVVMAQLPDRAWVAVQPKRRPNWWIWAVTAAVLALLVLAAFFLFGRGGASAVPDVVGQDQAAAVAELQDAGFTAEPLAAQAETDAPVGTVIAQTPAAGSRAQRGSTVTIQVLAGAQAATVPNVVGQQRADATSELQQAGFTVSVLEQPSDAPDGEVIEQRPPAGSRLAPESTVTIVVSRAEQAATVSVPSVEGLVEQDAIAAIRAAGLRYVVVDNPSAEVAQGVVALQYPDANMQVDSGATVALIVSSGPPEDSATAEVPDVVGEERLDAQELLTDAGFSSQLVTVAGTNENSGDVVAQLPAAGEEVPPGSTVVLFYAQ